MGKEDFQENQVSQNSQTESPRPEEDLEFLYDRKELRLPSGVRKRIRILKSQARREADEEKKERKLQEIFLYLQKEREKIRQKRKPTKEERALGGLDQTIVRILEAPDGSQREQEEVVRAVWLAEAARITTSPEERIEELGRSSLPAEVMVEIRQEVQPFLPMPSSPRRR